MSITKSEPTVRRKRRSPEDAREQILASARGLLLAEGPEAITLKAVAGELGMSHANLLHHFGSAAGLRSALITQMSRGVIAAVQDVSARVRDGSVDRRAVVDLVFDAVGAGGAGRLIAWMALAGETRHLVPVFDAVRELVDALEANDEGERGEARVRIATEILAVLLPAIGDALIGGELHEALARPRETGRDLAAMAMRAVAAGAPPHND